MERSAIVAPAIWPGAPLPLQPGDLSRFAPMGMNLGGVAPMRPWDSLDATRATRDWYALQPHEPHPLRDAPETDPAGGVVYFDNAIAPEQFATLLAILDVPDAATSFALFRSDAERPIEERYLAQLRAVMPYGLAALFGAAAHPELVEQPLPLGTALSDFLAAERERWGTRMGGKLTGTFGGDGDWAKEKLCFGFMVENAYHGVFRIWSRAWLVTK